MKATEQYFPVMLFIILYKVIPMFKSLDEILKGDHSDENVICEVARFCGVASSASSVWGGSKFSLCGLNPHV